MRSLNTYSGESFVVVDADVSTSLDQLLNTLLMPTVYTTTMVSQCHTIVDYNLTDLIALWCSFLCMYICLYDTVLLLNFGTKIIIMPIFMEVNI